MNFQLLRTLAVGSLCLAAIPNRRASTRYLTMEAIHIARYCGANDFGFGAVNELTARTMQLEKLDRLKKAWRLEARGAARSSAAPCYFPEV
jgi:2-iminoacetate synthase ThiH